MSWVAIIILLILGISLVALEIVALPGLVSGIVGMVFLGVGVWHSYSTYGTVAGNVVLLSSVVVCLLLIVFLMRSKTWRFFGLKAEIDSKVNTVDEQVLPVGARGTTLSRLAPTGKALINGQQVEVHTVSDFVDENVEVEITKVEGYKITVKKVEKE
jgi:membrane-bound ClpP family serine protease